MVCLCASPRKNSYDGWTLLICTIEEEKLERCQTELRGTLNVQPRPLRLHCNPLLMSVVLTDCSRTAQLKEVSRLQSSRFWRRVVSNHLPVVYTASQTKRQRWTSSKPWHHQILHGNGKNNVLDIRVKVWTGFNWFKKVANRGLLSTRKQTFGFHKIGLFLHQLINYRFLKDSVVYSWLERVRNLTHFL